MIKLYMTKEEIDAVASIRTRKTEQLQKKPLTYEARARSIAYHQRCVVTEVNAARYEAGLIPLDLK